MANTESPVTACVVVIGNEILSGRTQDQNLAFIGKRCDELGIILKESRIIPDIEEIIIRTVSECKDNFNYVFTTGGIGPTHDDITTTSIARLFNKQVERHEEAVRIMMEYYGPERLNTARLKMADIPVGADLINNPVSAAPGFQIENVFVLPGVPLIMQAMFEGITDRLVGGAPVLTGSIITGLTEGSIAQGLGMLQERYPGVSIGSYPFFRSGKLGVNIVMRTTNADDLEKLSAEIKAMILGLDGEIISSD